MAPSEADFLGQDPSGAFHLCEWKRAVDYEKKAAEVCRGSEGSEATDVFFLDHQTPPLG